MADDAQNESQEAEQQGPSWPRQQVYYLTVDWLDDPHKPESPERLAIVLRHAIEHAHSYPAGVPPARFIVRVKAGDVVSEVTGTVAHHHH
jgi:hypothetical protein